MPKNTSRKGKRRRYLTRLTGPSDPDREFDSWLDHDVPYEQLPLEPSLSRRLRARHWPRLRVRFEATDGADAKRILRRLRMRHGGARVVIETLSAAPEDALPPVSQDPAVLLGYEDRRGRALGTSQDQHERLDVHLGVMVLEVVRQAIIARAAPSKQERARARERLRDASGALSVPWRRNVDEARLGLKERPKGSFVSELASILNLARRDFRSRRQRSGEAAATEFARERWERHVRFVMKLWELSGRKARWERIDSEYQWRRMLSRGARPGERVARNIAVTLLGVERGS